MKNIDITGNTYRTHDYSLFKRLEGNRAVLASRVSKILNSINAYGYIFNPIVVNELYQIIDGQGRFEALKTLDMPIDFVVSEGAGLLECVALNSSGTIWTLGDYIDSYCELNLPDYLRLKQIILRYPTLPERIVINTVNGTAQTPSNFIKNGDFKVSEQQAASAIEDLDLINKIYPALKKITGGTGYYPYAIAFAKHCNADEERLLLTMLRTDLDSAPSVRKALDNVSDVYNWKLRDQTKRIYLYSLYEKTNSGKFSWYSPYWSRSARVKAIAVDEGNI